MCQTGPKLSEPRTPVAKVASCLPMTTVLGRLSTVLADRYTIEYELGAGGMATIYLAEDLGLRGGWPTDSRGSQSKRELTTGRTA